MREFAAKVKKSRNGALYFDIPGEIMKSMNIKPFMAGKMKIEDRMIRIYDFKKTKKIRINLEKKTIATLRRIMKLEGYGSLDETIANIIEKSYAKMRGVEIEHHTAYIYPEGFMSSRFELINDYEKAMKKGKSGKKKRIKN